VPQLLERWLDALDATGRWALLKLLTGGLRVGVSARLAKQALAQMGDVPVSDIEEVWHSQDPPYATCSPGWNGAAKSPAQKRRAASAP
jgi:DNA ligase-1